MRKRIGILLILTAVVLFAATAVRYYPKLQDYKKSRDLYNDIRGMYTDSDENNFPSEEENVIQEPKIEALLTGISEKEAASEFLPIKVDHKKLLEENADYIGWIYIPGTDISYPVTASQDNNDYLHTNFRKEYNFPGTIFMDCRNKKGVLDHHTVLYGHNMRDGSMFAGIKKYREQDFWEKHPVFWFLTPDYSILYHIFSAYAADPYDERTYAFEGEQYFDNVEFDGIIGSMEQLSEINTGVDVDGMDFIMTLSTCSGDGYGRFVVHGKMIGTMKHE